MPQHRSRSRRSFLASSSGLAVAPFVGTLGALQARIAHASGTSALVASPFGPVAPVNDRATGLPLIKLPAGFSYTSHGWAGDPMSDGQPTPGSHDGMGVIRSRPAGRGTEMVLVRNHERGNSSTPIITSRPGYDLVAAAGSTSRPGGGTTTLVFRDSAWVSSVGSLSGTLTNCAGGVTPWGTWLSCEETLSSRLATVAANGATGRKHGYVFEVPADPAQTSAQPIVDMGRFQHEAAAVDPQTGFVYQTQDAGWVSGLYRFEPKVTSGALGSLARGGTLKMAKIRRVVNGSPQFPTAPLLAPRRDDAFELEWVTIDNPDADPVSMPADAFPFVSGPVTVAGCFKEGFEKRGAQMNRGEGIWHHNRSMFIVDTEGGLGANGTLGGKGCVWELRLDTQVLTCIFVVPAGQPGVGNNADNITVSPKGGVLVLEDGGTHTQDGIVQGCRIMGILPNGNTFVLAENNLTTPVLTQAAAQGKATGTSDGRGSEFCGGCFSPDGRFLFANIQTPGITLAISGPWGAGPL